MINSDLTRNAIQQLPVVEKPEFEDDFFGHVTDPADPHVENTDVGPPPVKKQKAEDPDDQYKRYRKRKRHAGRAARKTALLSTDHEYYDVLPDPDPDSDNSDIENDDGEKLQIRVESQISIKLIKMWTNRYAELEVQERLNHENRKFEILEILSIRAAVPYETFTARFALKAKSIHVIIAPRTIFINIGSQDAHTDTSVQYWSHQDGCLFRYGDKVRFFEGIKYQHLAAMHFFNLVENPKDKFETLQFSTKEFDSKRDPANWPFLSFYRKIQKLLQSGNQKLRVESFKMTFHQYLGNPLSGEKILKSIFPYLNPKDLIWIKLRVWNDDEVLEMRGLENFEKWFTIPKHLGTMKSVFRGADDVDILDECISVVDFDSLWVHNTVHMVLKTDDFMLLAESCPIDDAEPGKYIEFRLDDDFDMETAESDLMSSNLATVHDNELTLGDGTIRVLFSEEDEPKCIKFICS